MPLNMEPDKFGDAHDRFDSLFAEDAERDPLWDLLSAYADGETNGAESKQIEALLKSDPLLAQELRFFQSTHHILTTTPEIEPPASLRTQILAATTQRLTLRRRVVNLMGRWRTPLLPAMNRYAMPLGALTATAMVTFLYLNRQEEQRLTTPIAIKQKSTEVAQNIPSSKNSSEALPFDGAEDISIPEPQEQGTTPSQPTPSTINKRSPAVARASATDHRTLMNASLVIENLHRPSPVQKGSAVAQKSPANGENSTGAVIAEKPQEPKVIMADFAPKPMMEAENQRPVIQMAKANSEIPEVRNHEGETTETSVASSSVTPSSAERLKARLSQSRQMLLADIGRNRRTPSDGSNFGATVQDANVRLVDNLKRSQSSALFVGRF